MSKPITLPLTGKPTMQSLYEFADKVKNNGLFRSPLRVSDGKEGKVLHERTLGQFFKEKLFFSRDKVLEARKAAHDTVERVLQEMDGKGCQALNDIHQQIGDGTRDIRVRGKLVDSLHNVAY